MYKIDGMNGIKMNSMAQNYLLIKARRAEIFIAPGAHPENRRSNDEPRTLKG
jgi:hypothetical protein